MKRAILFLAPVLLLLLDSCGAALHRDIPKADNRYQRSKLTTVEEEKALPANKAARVLLREEPLIVAAEPTAAPTVEPTAAIAEEKAATTPETVIVQRVAVPPHGDTLTEEETADEFDEAALDEAFDSERIARSAYHFSFLPIFSLIFFPMLFIGVIGTLIQLSRFKKFEYVTEAALDYEDRARRTLIISIIVPIATMLLLVLLLLLFL